MIRIPAMLAFPTWIDELLRLWQVHDATFEEMLGRIPYDWTPLHYIVQWAWMQIVGQSIEAHRYMKVLMGLLTLALTFRIAYDVSLSYSQRQRLLWAMGASVTYSLLGYVIFADVDGNAYGMLLMLWAYTLWLLTRWFKCIDWRLDMLLLISLSALVWTSYTALPAIGFLTVIVVVIAPHRLWRWIALGCGVIILCLPVLPQLFMGSGERLNLMAQALPSIEEASVTIYSNLLGNVEMIIVGVVAWIGALVLMSLDILRGHTIRGRWAGVFLLWALMPLTLLLANNIGLLKARYVWWTALSFALLMGYVIVSLPRYSGVVALIVFLWVASLPIDFEVHRWQAYDTAPYRHVLKNFAQTMQPHDVLLIDPICYCGSPYMWDYLMPQYITNGRLPLVTQVDESHVRVWYLSSDTGQTPTLMAQINEGRTASRFFGSWNFMLRLYERPQYLEGAVFMADDTAQVQLHEVSFDRERAIYNPDERFTVRLSWSSLADLSVDYSVSVALLRNGVLVAQSDSILGDLASSQWQLDEYHHQEHQLDWSSIMTNRTGTYELVIAVYSWLDQQRLTPTLVPEGSSWVIRDDDYLAIATLYVDDWTR